MDRLLSLGVNPTNIISDIEIVKHALITTKRDLPGFTEVERIMELLKKQKKSKPLQVSEGLCKAANKQIEIFLQSGEAEFNQTTSSNRDTADVIVKKYAKKTGKIFQIQDSCSDGKLFFSRIFITNTDKERKNEKILLNDNLKYFGIGVKNLGRNSLVNILFTDTLEELEENNIDDTIVNEINNLRTKSESAVLHYNEIERNVLNLKASLNENQINKFYDYMYKGSVNKPMTRNPILDELALELLRYSIENDNMKLLNHNDGVYIPAQENLESITNRFLSDYKIVESFIVQGPPQNAEEMINRILFSGRKHDNQNLDNIDILLLNKDYKSIGAAYEENVHSKTNQKIAFASVFLIDDFSAAPKRPYLDVLKEEFSNLRKNPRSFLDDLHA